jgi:hypothetical protein
MKYPSPRETTPQQPTMAYRPGQMPPPPPPPAWSPTPMPQPQKRSIWPWLIGIGVVLVLMGIGVVVLVIAIASITSNNNNNGRANLNNSNGTTANRTSDANISTSNTNTTTSSPAFFSDDFSAENWSSGPSKFGRTWYDNNEYHMYATKNGYIVMYAPNATHYGTENATVRITTRNVEGSETGKGYGLLVHGEMKNNQIEDYGFLIDNGTKGYYRVIEHKGGAETQLVSWTASSTIRTGTSPNQLEVRITDRKIEFYINGQYVTSITDAEGFLRGKVGLYTSDTSEVAFDDLEVSK